MTFRSLEHKLRHITLTHFASSSRYVGVADTFDTILLLADRVVRACEHHPELGRAAEITAALSTLSQESEGSLEGLLDRVELWLKAIVRLALPSRYAARRNADNQAAKAGKSRRTFNLFACMEDLGLATTSELNYSPDTIDTVHDRVVRYLWYAKFDRNNATHETHLSDLELKTRQTIGACVAILAPLHVHGEAIRQSLHALVTHDPALRSAVNVNKMVESELRGHLSRFRSRTDCVREVLDAIEETRGVGYVLVTAEEGAGKSALCARISEELRLRALEMASSEVWGKHAGIMAKELPWLPGSIIHFGKSARDPEHIADFLLTQINCMTIDEIVDRAPSDGVDDSSSQDDDDLPLNRTIDRNPAQPLHTPVRPFDDASHSSRQRRPVRGEQIRRNVYAALETLGRERGHVVLIVDALEEISDDPTAFAFLPCALPPGVSALLTSRGSTPAVHWAENTLPIARRLTLILRREDIPHLSGVFDDSPDHTKFNDRLFRESGGLPLQIQRMLDGVDLSRDALSQITLERGTKKLHAKQVSAWTKLGPIGKHSLIALALFEPVAPLSLETLQYFLAARIGGDPPDLSDLREILLPVANQTQGFDDRYLKLASRPFASYVCDEHFSKTDLNRPLEAARSALVSDTSAPASLLAGFLECWGHSSRHPQHRAIVNGLIDDLAAVADAKRLFGITIHCRVWENPDKSFAIDSVRRAASMMHPAAMRILGMLVLDGVGQPPDPIEGRRLLELASDKGDKKALLVLGERLSSGRGLAKSAQEGLDFLERAARSQVNGAHFALGLRLARGLGVTRDITRATTLLAQAESKGDVRASYVLGNLLLNENDADCRVRGEACLTKAAERGFEAAMVQAGIRLLRGQGVTRDAKAGRSWLEKAVQQGSTTAMLSLSSYLFAGEVLPADKDTALNLLTRASDAGDDRALLQLGLHLLSGDGVAHDEPQAINLITQSAQCGNRVAIERLANIYLERLRQVSQRRVAEEWFINAIETFQPSHVVLLGYSLYQGNERALAALAFRGSFARGEVLGGLNLFYMLRRGEAALSTADGPPHLLAESLAYGKNAFAMMNRALAIASGFECSIDWPTSDAIIAEIVLDDDNRDLVEWWHRLATSDDGEGHLVLGWLSRHGKCRDPDDWSAIRRFEAATDRGWDIPDWLKLDVSS